MTNIKKTKSTVILSTKMIEYFFNEDERNAFEDSMKEVALDFLEWTFKNGYFKPLTAVTQFGDELFERYNNEKNK